MYYTFNFNNVKRQYYPTGIGQPLTYVTGAEGTAGGCKGVYPLLTERYEHKRQQYLLQVPTGTTSSRISFCFSFFLKEREITGGMGEDPPLKSEYLPIGANISRYYEEGLRSSPSEQRAGI